MFPFYGTDYRHADAEMIHAVVAMLFIAAMLGHIYIGTIGMEGAFEAMGEGTVDVNWAKEHHRLWLEEEMRRSPKGARAQPPNNRAETSMQDARLQSRAFCYKGAMRIIGLAGWSGSGKTTLITKLIPRLIARGVKVSRSSTPITASTWISRARIPSSIAPPVRPKSSFHRPSAGHPARTARGAGMGFGRAVAKMSPVDLVLVEGFKREPFPSWKSIAPPTASR